MGVLRGLVRCLGGGAGGAVRCGARRAVVSGGALMGLCGGLVLGVVGGPAGGLAVGGLGVVLAAPEAGAAVDERWVLVTMRNGQEFRGRVVEADRFKVVLELTTAGITVERTFARGDLASIEELEVDASAVRPPRDAEAEELEVEGGYVVVELEGQIGREITAEIFERVLKQAERRGVEAVVFDMDTPGGVLLTVNRILDVLDSYRGRIKMVAFIDGECYSGGAIVAYCGMDEILMGPGGTIGAAVIVQGGREAGEWEAAEAKFAAAQVADWRSRAERLGRYGAVMDAMSLQPAELYAWWRDGEGEPPVLVGARPEGGGAVEEIDDEDTVLALTSSEAVRLGLAGEYVRRVGDVGDAGVLRGKGERDAESLSRMVSGYQSRVERELRLVSRTADRVNETLALLGDEETTFDTRSELYRTMRDLLRDVRRIERLGRQFEYVELEIMRWHGGMENIREWIDLIEGWIERVRRL